MYGGPGARKAGRRERAAARQRWLARRALAAPLAPRYPFTMIDLPHLRAQRELILQLAESYGARNVRVFGSVARGEARSGSDVDLLVDFAPGASLLEWSAFWQALEAALGHPVDVAVETDLRPEVRDDVLREAIAL